MRFNIETDENDEEPVFRARLVIHTDKALVMEGYNHTESRWQAITWITSKGLVRFSQSSAKELELELKL